MSKLNTTFAGLSLRNPLIVASSGLTSTPEKVASLCHAGVGAVVLKSIFEEQIMQETFHMSAHGGYAEAADYLTSYVRSHALNEYVRLIEESKKQADIPVIASINCYSPTEWVDYARTLAQAGADALEVNILSLQTEKTYRHGNYEQLHIDVLDNVKNAVNLPVILKLGTNFTNPVALIHQLYTHGASAVVLFNRPYQPDIDVEKMQYISADVFSTPAELPQRIRWTGITSLQVPRLDLAVSGGVRSGQDIVKSILAGATAVEVCSAIYQGGTPAIKEMISTLERWMIRHDYESIAQFKGLMNAQQAGGYTNFERTQFMKFFSSRED
jgi:dihydroorotate dehydrogenase (fumarate)